MSQKILLSCLVSLVIFSKTGISQPVIFIDTAITTLKSGNWSDPLVWKGLRVPDYRDSVVLLHQLVVDVDATCRSLNLNGKNISINPGVKFKIDGTPIVINSSTRLIDSTKLKLISTPVEKEKGWFIYQLLQSSTLPGPGNVIIDNSDDGYLRSVDSIKQNGDKLTLFTKQADMEDIFKTARFGFNLPLSNLQEQNISGGSESSTETALQNLDDFNVSVSPRTLYSLGPVSVNLLQANLGIKPDMRFDFDYDGDGLKYLTLESKQAKLQGNLSVQLLASGATSGSRVDTLKRYGMTRIVFIYGIPVHMKIDFFLISTLSFSAEAQISRTFNFNLDETFYMKAAYNRDAGWVNQFEIKDSKSKIDLGIFSGTAKAELGIDIKPLIKVRFYSLVAPYVFLDARSKFTGRATSPALYWDFHAKGWVEPGIGMEVKIFGKRPAKDFGPARWSSDTLNYRTPFLIQKLSGDNQVSDDTLKYLPNPIKVKVLDELNSPQSNVVVKFKILSGKGQLADTTALTDASGIAEMQWKIGSQVEQTLEVSAFKGDSSAINGSPVTFTAIYGAKKELKVIKIFNSANTPVFTTNFFKQAGVGKGGHIYAGTINNGLYKCVDSTWTKLGVLTNNNINDIQTDQFGGVWIAQYGSSGAQATTGGINHFPDSSSNGFMYYGATLGAPTRNARGIFCDTTRTNGDGRPRLWTAHMAHITAGVSTTGAIGLGLNAANPFFNKITNGIDVSIQNGSIPCIGGNSSEIWAYASVNFGKSQILRYSAATGSFLGAYDYENTTVTGMTSNFVARAIHFDATGSRWIGLISGGLLVKENDAWTNINMPEILPASTAISTNGISSGKFGKVFIATSQGLLIYNGGDKSNPASYKRVTTAEGLPSNNVLDAVERSSDGLLIVTTDAGIAFITGH